MGNGALFQLLTQCTRSANWVRTDHICCTCIGLSQGCVSHCDSNGVQMFGSYILSTKNSSRKASLKFYWTLLRSLPSADEGFSSVYLFFYLFICLRSSPAVLDQY